LIIDQVNKNKQESNCGWFIYNLPAYCTQPDGKY